MIKITSIANASHSRLFFAMKQGNQRVTGVATVVTLRYDLFAVQLVSRCNERAIAIG